MRSPKTLTGIFAATGMLVLILDGQTAIQGASEGIDLCIRTVIPSLFPFFILSVLLTGIVAGTRSSLLRPIATLFGIPHGTEPLLLTAFLGGYPVGAQTVAAAWRNGQISRDTAERMLCFCNNPGPSFIFGMVAAFFPALWYGWIIWGIQILSALAVARTIPAGRGALLKPQGAKETTITQALQLSLRIMATVCGWVVVFRVILAFMNRWFFWLLPKDLLVLFTGILELTNGCCMLSDIKNIGSRLILSSLMLSWGGLCVLMQTSSVLQGLNIKTYLKGKYLQTIYATAFSVLVQYILPGKSNLHPVFLIVILLPLLPWILRKRENNYSLSAENVV